MHLLEIVFGGFVPPNRIEEPKVGMRLLVTLTILLSVAMGLVNAFPSILSQSSAMSTSTFPPTLRPPPPSHLIAYPPHRSPTDSCTIYDSILQVHLLLQLDHSPALPPEGSSLPLPHLYSPILSRSEVARLLECEDGGGGFGYGNW